MKEQNRKWVRVEEGVQAWSAVGEGETLALLMQKCWEINGIFL